MFELTAARLPLPPREVEVASRFGAAVATDGRAVLVGAPSHDLRGLLRRRVDAGRVYLFEGEGLAWSLAQELDPGHPAASSAAFGQAVALDGPTIVVGAPLAAEEGTPLAGFAQVFERDPEHPRGYLPTARLQADRQGELGAAVAVQGRLVVVGAPFQRVGAESLHPASGSVHLYEEPPALRAERRLEPGSAERGWTRGPVLESPLPGLAAGSFGAHLALSGRRLLVSEEWSADSGGLARIYTLGAEDWGGEAVLRLCATLEERAAAGARSVAIDGDLAAVGIPTVHSSGMREVGAVQLFHRAGHRWNLAAVLEPPSDERCEELRFGFSVALTGGRVVVGAPGWGSGPRRPGAVWFYAPGPRGWLVAHRYVPFVAGTADQAEPARFGAAVAARGRLVVVGAPGWDTGADPGAELTDAGAAWVFTLS